MNTKADLTSVNYETTDIDTDKRYLQGLIDGTDPDMQEEITGTRMEILCNKYEDSGDKAMQELIEKATRAWFESIKKRMDEYFIQSEETFREQLKDPYYPSSLLLPRICACCQKLTEREIAFLKFIQSEGSFDGQTLTDVIGFEDYGVEDFIYACEKKITSDIRLNGLFYVGEEKPEFISEKYFKTYVANSEDDFPFMVTGFQSIALAIFTQAVLVYNDWYEDDRGNPGDFFPQDVLRLVLEFLLRKGFNLDENCGLNGYYFLLPLKYLRFTKTIQGLDLFKKAGGDLLIDGIRFIDDDLLKETLEIWIDCKTVTADEPHSFNDLPLMEYIWWAVEGVDKGQNRESYCFLGQPMKDLVLATYKLEVEDEGKTRTESRDTLALLTSDDKLLRVDELAIYDPDFVSKVTETRSLKELLPFGLLEDSTFLEQIIPNNLFDRYGINYRALSNGNGWFLFSDGTALNFKGHQIMVQNWKESPHFEKFRTIYEKAKQREARRKALRKERQ